MMFHHLSLILRAIRNFRDEHCSKARTLFLSLILFLCLLPSPAGVYAIDVAVIVHQDNTLDEISRRDLSRLFKGEKRHWADASNVYVIMQEDGSPEKGLIVRKIFKMRPNELKRYWLTKIIKGELLSFPRTLSSSDAVKRFVRHIPSAIAYVNADAVDGSVKVLRIDGKKPGEKGYFLSGR